MIQKGGDKIVVNDKDYLIKLINNGESNEQSGIRKACSTATSMHQN